MVEKKEKAYDGATNPQTLEWATLMQIVPGFSKIYCSEFTKTRHLKRKIHFFLERGPAPLPDLFPGTPIKPFRSASAFPRNSGQNYTYEFTAGFVR